MAREQWGGMGVGENDSQRQGGENEILGQLPP